MWNVNTINGFNWFILQYMGTVLAVVYAADTIVAFKYYRDSGDWLSHGEWSVFFLADCGSDDYDRVIIRLI